MEWCVPLPVGSVSIFTQTEGCRRMPVTSGGLFGWLFIDSMIWGIHLEIQKQIHPNCLPNQGAGILFHLSRKRTGSRSLSKDRSLGTHQPDTKRDFSQKIILCSAFSLLEESNNSWPPLSLHYSQAVLGIPFNPHNNSRRQALLPPPC